MPTGIYVRTQAHKDLFVGRKLSKQTKKKMSDSHKAQSAISRERMLKQWSDPLYRQNMSDAHKGTSQTLESREKRSKLMTGSKHPQWQGGKTKASRRLRGTMKYKLWRESVFKRDDWTCQECKSRGIELNADHIKPFAFFPELRFALENGRTLCVPCHKETPTYLWKGLKIKQTI